MKTKLATTFFLFLCKFLLGQKSENQIEVNPYFRWDKYPKFSYSINSVNSYSVKITGTSIGINTAYNFPLQKNQLFIKSGLGYYKYTFNKIAQVNSQFGSSNNRVVENYSPPGGITPGIIYKTDKYFYNTISLLIGIEKHSSLSKDMQLDYGLLVTNYLTFSQLYHITYPSPEGDNYKQTNSRYFGFSGNIEIGIKKKIKRITIGPKIILGIYNNWKKDGVFPQEENGGSRSKWLSGIGAGISINYLIPKPNHNEK